MTETTQTTQTTDTDTAEDLDAVFDAAFAAMMNEVLNAPIEDLPIQGALIPFPSPFADA